jgi:hypothetical protein
MQQIYLQKLSQLTKYWGAQMHYKPCIEIIGGARALLPMEVYAYATAVKTGGF